MKFENLPLAGSKLVYGQSAADSRGFFERIASVEEFAGQGLQTVFAQTSMSWNEVAGTRRGLHFQTGDHEETKLIRCVAGAIYDVILDLRPQSQTFGRWHAEVMSARSHFSIYVPEGFAHGFQTLQDDTSILYLISKPYAPGHIAGIASDDPELGIAWPSAATRMSEADRAWPPLRQWAMTRE